jgi:hypothetical protein
MRTTLLALFFLLPGFTLSAYSQKNEKDNPCFFIIKSDDKFLGKEVIVTKIGITGLSIKATEQVKKKLNLFTEDKIVISEEVLTAKFSNICKYKSWFLDKIEFTYEENSKYQKYIPMIVQFHYAKR